MKKALVLGATGGMGSAIVKELQSRGVEVVAFARNKDRLNRMFGGSPGVQIYAGNAAQETDLRAASTGADTIFHAVGLPYAKWESQFTPIMDSVLKTARQTGSNLVLVDNFYAYGPSRKERYRETDDKLPQTKKGKYRLKQESLAKQAGVPVIVAHFPDFYGPDAENTLLHYLFQAMIQNKGARFVGSLAVPREYIYTPDGAKALVELASRESSYHQNWNIPGAGLITGNEIVEIAKAALNYNRKVSPVSKNMIRFLGLFDRNMREFVEMYYALEKPVLLSGVKYENNIGKLPRTPYEEGIRQTIAAMKGH